jgi:hypothetical protein
VKTVLQLAWVLADLVVSILVGAFVLLPFYLARRLLRWYRLPQWKRDAINRESRLATEHGWQQVENLIRTELIIHKLADTPENRVKLNSTRSRRRG